MIQVIVRVGVAGTRRQKEELDALNQEILQRGFGQDGVKSGSQ